MKVKIRISRIYKINIFRQYPLPRTKRSQMAKRQVSSAPSFTDALLFPPHPFPPTWLNPHPVTRAPTQTKLELYHGQIMWPLSIAVRSRTPSRQQSVSLIFVSLMFVFLDFFGASLWLIFWLRKVSLEWDREVIKITSCTLADVWRQ